MVAAHEIFQKPLTVKLAYEDVETPKNYRNWPEGASLPEKIPVWKVFEKLPEKDYGLVSDPYGFTDSPDCEFIASGVNSKGPTSVALGRQANFFLWGFCAPPSSMTESARRVFVNTIVYMKRFDGQKPLVTDPVSARGWAAIYPRYADKDGKLPDFARKVYTPALLAAGGEEPKALGAFLEANRKWLRFDPETKAYDLDTDAKELGIANDDVALLERCVTMLEKNDRVALAKRLLARYVAEKPGDDAKAWRAWLDANRSKLYFTDRGGYRFRVAPSSVMPSAPAAPSSPTPPAR